MPELPEVESVRLGLQKVLINQTILKVKVLDEKIVSSNSNIRIPNKEKTKEFINKIKNKKIIKIERRAKNIIILLDDDSIILIHLKMTGQLVYGGSAKIIGGHPILESYKNNLPNKHTHIIFELENGKLFYNDTRKFGYVLYYKNLEDAVDKKHFSKIGLEPFDENFTIKYFKENLNSKKYKNKILKSVFLDQSIVVGLGNIYADEVCFASDVLPQRKCGTLSEEEIKKLYKNIKLILKKAISLGGSSVSDYLLADGTRGNYARLHNVYGKAGSECVTCKNTLQKETLSGRTTVYCKVCQK